jgi:integrase
MIDGERLDRYKQGKPLSAKTIKNHISFVSTVFAHAIKQGVITYNPCSAVVLPKYVAQDMDVYSLEESDAIMRLLYKEDKRNLHYIVFFTLATYTGFRRGELLGIEWKDIDFDKKLLTLNRQSCYDKEKGVFTDTLKTRASYRCLQLLTEIMELLQHYRQYQVDYIRSVGSSWVETINGLNDKIVDNDRLFTQWDGKPMFPNSPALYFGRFCKRHGLVYRKLHSFRHYNATMQVWAGVDPKTIQSNLGHSQCSTTMNVYAKTFRQAQAVSMDKLADVIGRPPIQALLE